jgi:phosphate:Na+ symporter
LSAKKKTEGFLTSVVEILKSKDNLHFENVTQLYQLIEKGYGDSLHALYKKGFQQHLNDIETSTIINFNREIYTAFKSMVLALKDLVLTKKEAEYFDDLPGFIR